MICRNDDHLASRTTTMAPRYSAEQCGLGLRLRNDPVGQAGVGESGMYDGPLVACVVPLPLPFSFPLRLEKDEDFLDAVRAQLRALGQEQDGKIGKVRMRPTAAPNKAGMIRMIGHDWNVGWTEVGQAS